MGQGPRSAGRGREEDVAALRVGVISDTNGLLRPEAAAFLRGSHCIVHGGDIGGAGILEALGEIAPVTAVRGNNDFGAWAEGIHDTERLEIGGITIYAIHDLSQMRIDPRSAGVRVVVCGHSHKPIVEDRQGVLLVNPGSAGPRRFRLPISIGEIIIGNDGAISARTVELAIQNPT